jgi:sulfhydrogenase subunit delta
MSASVNPLPRPAAGRAAAVRRPRVGIVKFASCDGCQLTLLDLEDELLAVAEHFEIVEFAEATSRRSQGPFDVLLVEGSISTPEQAEEIVRLRREATTLVTIGACATSGGIQALRNLGDHDAFRNAVYPRPELVESLAT